MSFILQSDGRFFPGARGLSRAAQSYNIIQINDLGHPYFAKLYQSGPKPAISGGDEIQPDCNWGETSKYRLDIAMQGWIVLESALARVKSERVVLIFWYGYKPSGVCNDHQSGNF
jgi:hypothetical protein